MKAISSMSNPGAKIAELTAALKPLENIGKSNLSSCNQISLKKLPN
jgi:hypothetical protein